MLHIPVMPEETMSLLAVRPDGEAPAKRKEESDSSLAATQNLFATR